ncbi:MAG TPA: translocation/assembly module TamB domain-containing protein, partial [Chitinophagaceae bacterium]|nr:translocation/assembly module TamB domain-containing protein [Chitinophagaceae bacterium]
VVASLTGDLFKPTISFSLDFPPSSPAVSDPELALIMQKIQANTNELNKQVTYLIVFNSFAPSELESNPVDNGININTISGIFLNVISDQINKIFGNLLKNDKYRISLNTSLYNRNIIDNNSTSLKYGLGSNVNFSIGRSFFNNRFIITAGGGFDAPLQASSIQQSIQLLPDVTLEWLINESGTIRATFFYRENSDYLSTSTSGGPGRAQRYGGSVTYRKDVDKLIDIFKGKKKKKKVKVEPQTGN